MDTKQRERESATIKRILALLTNPVAGTRMTQREDAIRQMCEEYLHPKKMDLPEVEVYVMDNDTVRLRTISKRTYNMRADLLAETHITKRLDGNWRAVSQERHPDFNSRTIIYQRARKKVRIEDMPRDPELAKEWFEALSDDDKAVILEALTT